MQNILMRYLRQVHKYTPSAMARKLHIDTTTYKGLETGEILMTQEQAKQIGAIFNVKPHLIYEEAMQVDASLTQIVVIRVLKKSIKGMKAPNT